MRDIVATIQAEQDEIIRLDHPEVLVIEAARAPGSPWWRCTASFCRGFGDTIFVRSVLRYNKGR